MTIELSILIVSYNTKDLTLQTIDSVVRALKTDHALRKATEIIVIDNNSTDGSKTALAQLANTSDIPIVVLQQQENLGFAAANNEGIKRARGNHYLLLNSDTIVEEGALTHLWQVAHNTQYATYGILAAELRNTDGSLQPQGGDLPSLCSLINQQLFLDDIPFFGKRL
ncbi:glycosyltransferase, partial [Candidatus Woesebacteria bacterium]|nr:glycosyltransferase [Candidatus Woesebacteria bacterium]